MKPLRYHEDLRRGSMDFPLDYHAIDERHPRYEMPYHWHEETELLHVRSGTFALSVDGESYLLRPGDVAYIAPGRLHGGSPDGCVYDCAVFDMRLLLRVGERCRRQVSDVLSRRADVDVFFPSGSEVARPVAPMFEALRGGKEGYELATLGGLLQFLGECYRLRAYQPRQEPPEARKVSRLKRVFELIESRYDRPPTLGELAASVGMTPKYFCRFFKAATHSTPMDYIGFYRVEAACQELAATDKNVTEVAMDMGYADVGYFIRCFKKYKGVTPKQYARMLS